MTSYSMVCRWEHCGRKCVYPSCLWPVEEPYEGPGAVVPVLPEKPPETWIEAMARAMAAAHFRKSLRPDALLPEEEAATLVNALWRVYVGQARAAYGALQRIRSVVIAEGR